VFKTNGVEKMRLLNATGYFGINIPAPSERLDVGGNIRLNDNKLFLSLGTNTTNYLAFNSGAGGPALIGNTGGTLGTLSGGSKSAFKWG